jgi:hypothetical protein
MEWRKMVWLALAAAVAAASGVPAKAAGGAMAKTERAIFALG